MKDKTLAGPALLAALRSDVDRLVSSEHAVRADANDSIHQMRVATRRLRSVMRSFKKLLPHDENAHLKDELKWLAGLLGHARDAEVLADRFEKLIGAQPQELMVGPIRDRLVGAQRAHYRAAHRDVVEALDTPRFQQLKEDLASLVVSDLTRKEADAPAARVFTTCLCGDYERLRDAVRTHFAAAGEDHIESLHDVRKSAKALRYSGEAATDVLGATADSVASAAKSLQSVLGDWRDAVEARTHIVTVAEQAREAGEDGFGYGVLYEVESVAVDTNLAGYRPALDRLTQACVVLR